MKGMLIADRYRVLSKLGEGATGEVYLALHVGLGRKEAIKVLPADLAGDAGFVARFRREARAANRVDHPAVVRVYDFGQLPDGRCFLATEHAEGQRLDIAITEQGALSVERTLDVLRQLAEAVARAHERGVVHRDLKPENMVLVPLGGGAEQLKVFDFGIAGIVAPGVDDGDPRVDVYAIGCIAYEMLTGAPPTAAPPPPSKRRRQGPLPLALDQVVLRCLAMRPEDRFVDAQALGAALAAIGPGRPAEPLAGHAAFDEDEGTETVAEPPSIDPAAPALVAGGDTHSLVTAVRTLGEGLIASGVRDLRISVGLLELEEQTETLTRLDTELRAAERGGAPLDRAIAHAAARGHADDELDRLARSLARLCGEHRAMGDERAALGALFEAVDRLSAPA